MWKCMRPSNSSQLTVLFRTFLPESHYPSHKSWYLPKMAWNHWLIHVWLLLLLSHFSRVRLCVTHRGQPTRLRHPWDSPGKNTGVSCHFLLQCTQLSGPKSYFLIIYTLNSLFTKVWWMASCILSEVFTNHHGGWQHLEDCRHWVPFWELSFTFGGQKLLIAVMFLAHQYGRKYFTLTSFCRQICKSEYTF